MTEGYSGSYAINGTNLIQQPFFGHWINPEPLGIAGNHHPIYPGFREFEMRFSLMPMESWQQLQGFYDALGTTGTGVVTIPKFANPFIFYSYSGVTLKEPTVGDYFVDHVEDVVLTVLGIRTS